MGLVVLDLVRGEVEIDDRLVRLSRGEIALLKLLSEHPGRPVAAARLAEALGLPGGRAGNDSVRTRVARVRRKIEADPNQPTVLVTAGSGGYMLRGGAVVRRRRAWSPTPQMATLELTVGQHRLLEALNGARGHPLDWRALGQALGGRGDDEDRIRVRIAVHRLRRRLMARLDLPQVQYRRGFGYTLEAPTRGASAERDSA